MPHHDADVGRLPADLEGRLEVVDVAGGREHDRRAAGDDRPPRRAPGVRKSPRTNSAPAASARSIRSGLVLSSEMTVTGQPQPRRASTTWRPNRPRPQTMTGRMRRSIREAGRRSPVAPGPGRGRRRDGIPGLVHPRRRS